MIQVREYLYNQRHKLQYGAIDESIAKLEHGAARSRLGKDCRAKSSKEYKTGHREQRGNPGNPRAISPQKHENDYFIKTVVDLPCKRTCHGKGRMTKIINKTSASWPSGPDIYLMHHPRK